MLRILASLLLCFCGSCGEVVHPLSTYEGMSCQAKSRDALLSVLRKATVRNEEFRSIAGISNDDTQGASLKDSHYHSLRLENKNFYTNTLEPCLDNIVRMVRDNGDRELVDELVTVIASYGNYADEELSDVLARLYLHAPQATESAIMIQPQSRRGLIIRRLQFGWDNVREEEDTTTRIVVDEKLEHLSKFLPSSP